MENKEADIINCTFQGSNVPETVSLFHVKPFRVISFVVFLLIANTYYLSVTYFFRSPFLPFFRPLSIRSSRFYHISSLFHFFFF